MGKKITLINGPANGKNIEVNDKAEKIAVPYIGDNVNVSAFHEIQIIGWDEYGPIVKRQFDILQAVYVIDGNTAIYQSVT